MLTKSQFFINAFISLLFTVNTSFADQQCLSCLETPPDQKSMVPPKSKPNQIAQKYILPATKH